MSVGQKAVVHCNSAVLSARLGGHSSHSHNGTGGQSNTAGSNIARADHSCKVVECADVNVGSTAKTEFSGQFVGKLTCNGARLAKRRQLLFADANGIEHLFPIAFIVNIKIEREGGDRHICTHNAREIIDNVVFDKHIVCGVVKDFGLVVFKPQNLGRRPSGQHSLLTCNFFAFCGGKAFCQYFAFVNRTLVHPRNDVHHRLAFLVNNAKRFSLTCKGHLFYRFNIILLEHIAE